MIDTLGVKLAFLITGFDQKKETRYTINMLRNKWQSTKDCAIAIVMSGDPKREVDFPEDKLTRVTNNNDLVGKNFNGLVSTSIMKAIAQGMRELVDLRRIAGKPDIIIHLHSDVLLSNEEGFWQEVLGFWASQKQVAFDTVGPQSSDYISFCGKELMPQIFMAKTDFCDASFFMHITDTPELPDEIKSTEHALLGNLSRRSHWLIPGAALEGYPYTHVFDALVYEVEHWRSHQWGEHPNKYGGWGHYGNQLHMTQEVRETCGQRFLESRDESLD